MKKCNRFFFQPKTFFSAKFCLANFFFRLNFFSGHFFSHFFQIFFCQQVLTHGSNYFVILIFFFKICLFCFVDFLTFIPVFASFGSRIVWFCIKTNFEGFYPNYYFLFLYSLSEKVLRRILLVLNYVLKMASACLIYWFCECLPLLGPFSKNPLKNVSLKKLI